MYQVKGYIQSGDAQKCVTVIAEMAVSCSDAEAIANSAHITDCVSSSLTNIKEIFRSQNESDDWFTATVKEETGEGKAMSYQILIQAKTFDDANNIAKEQLLQGYGMAIVGLKKIKLYAVL